MVDGVSRIFEAKIRDQWRDLVNTVTKNQAPKIESNLFGVFFLSRRWLNADFWVDLYGSKT
jgi:hypothetical protein